MARTDVDYIMDTFAIVKRKDEERFGRDRTKELILEIFDRMQMAINSGKPYTTILDPPPGDLRCTPCPVPRRTGGLA